MIKKSTKLFKQLLVLCLFFTMSGVVSAQDVKTSEAKKAKTSNHTVEDHDEEELARKSKGTIPTMEEMVQGMQNGQKYNVKKVIKANGGEDLFTGKYDNPSLRESYNLQRLRDPNTGLIPEGIREQELEYVKSARSGMHGDVLFKSGIEGATTAAAGAQTSPWVNRGPYNVGGRTRALALDINNENRILAGGVSGGLWESLDQGQTWAKITPPLEHPSITDIVQDPRPGFQNVWYYSTGERLGPSQSGRNGSAFFQGNGIYKSVDNGNTWAVLASTRNDTPQSFSAADPFDLTFGIDIDPTNGNVYVATFAGIHRSTDGGVTFENVIPSDFDNFSAIHITDGGVLYATLDSGADLGGLNGGIFRSTDGAAGTWVEITPAGFPVVFGRTEISTAPSDPNILYVISSNTGSAPVSHDFWKYTYVSGDGSGAGGVWEDRTLNLPAFGGSVGSFNSQGGYDLYVKVHPTNPDLVLIGGTNIYRSTDGFATGGNTDWVAGYSPLNNVTLYTNQHPDQHSLVFLPSNPNTVISGHDGGLSIAADITEDNPGIEPVSWVSLNNGYLTTQVYALSIGPDDQIMAGFQDNSTWFANSTTVTDPWVDLFSGDGSYNAFSDDGTLRYMSSQNGNVFRVTYADANSSVPLAFQSIRPTGSSGFLFVNPFELDPNNDQIMYFAGGSLLWRNDNLSNANNSTGWTALTNAAAATGSISSIGISTAPSNVVYYGTTTGGVYRIDGASTGNPTGVDVFTGKGLPGGNVTSIAVDPNNASNVYIAFSNYSIQSIFFSDNGGTTWTAISGNLEVNPDGSGAGPSVRWIDIVGNNDLILAGTSTGLYSTSTTAGAATVWTQVDPSGIGNVVVEQVRSREDGLVVAGTHGNGLYSANFEVSMPQVVLANQVDNIEIPANSPDTQIDVSNVFASNASPALPITVSVNNNTNPSLVTTSLSGDILTLSYTPDASGTAVIELLGQDPNGDFAATTFVVRILPPPISSFPYVQNFDTGLLPDGWEIDGTMPWVVNSGFTPSIGTGPSADNTTGDLSGSYVYSEATGSVLGDQAILTTRPIDISSLNHPIMEFFYHMFGTSIGSLDVEVVELSTGTVTNVFSVSGSQQFSESDPYLNSFDIDLSAVSGLIQVRFISTRGLSFTSDIAIDDITIREQAANDVSVRNIQVSGGPFYSTAETVEVLINNFGTADQSNFPVSFSVDGGAAVTETFTATIAAGDTATFTFASTADISVPGAHTIFATTGLTTDENTSNDGTTVQFNTLPVATTFPYLEDFEGLSGVLPLGYEIDGVMPWLLNSGGTSSSRTGPLADHTTGDATGTYIYTEASGLANGDEGSFTTSAFDLSSLDKPALLQFWYHMFGNPIGTLNVELIDLTNNTTTTVFSVTGQQQTAQSDPYLQATIDLTEYSDILFRLRFRSIRGASFTSDIAVDDITISEIDNVLDMEVTSICTDNPEAERGWTVNNPNPFVREAFWFIIGSDQADSITLVPGENTFFTSTLTDVPNTIKLRWLDADGVQQETTAESTGTPCRVRGLILTSVCANNPEIFRRWEINNRNPYTVSVEWNLVGTDEIGFVNCAPGLSYFFTEALDGDNYVKIIWIDEEGNPRRQQKLSDAGMCDIDNSCSGGEVIAFEQGLRNNGSAVSELRSNPANAVGYPEQGDGYNFVSLGFGGQMTIQLNNVMVDQPGNDFVVLETSFQDLKAPCDEYPESADVYVSMDGVEFALLGSACGDQEFDISTVGLSEILFVKIVDTSNPSEFGETGDGFDLDGIACVNAFSSETEPFIPEQIQSNVVNEEIETIITTFPNPFRDRISVNMEVTPEKEGTYTILVHDVFGGLVYEGEVTTTFGKLNAEINAVNLAKGTYVLTVIPVSGDEEVKSNLLFKK